MIQPYYEEKGITIYHGDARDVLPFIRFDTVLTDPPYGINKAEWDAQFPSWLWSVLPFSLQSLGLMPGTWNLLKCPQRVHSLTYRWTLSAHLVNGMTRGAVGFANWIPCHLYSAPDISLFKQESDCRDFVVGSAPKEDHPSPKPLHVVKWFLSRLPDGIVCDPFMGAASTLRAAKDLGRKAIGIEIEERYAEIAANRLRQEVLQFEEA